MSAPVLTAKGVRTMLATACLEAGSQKAFATRAGISGAYLSSVLTGRREPGEAILVALGLERITVYRSTK